ncbi:MAG TPA: zf-TFIIB domain-containing protein [Gemmatimonadaceae bacterium]|nr:zf-TFIIB domain-containing protein [Gemmatimonadaceae bacterium]
MPKVEPRYPCPVCLGSHLEKTRVGKADELELDHCRRCGGVWFELGEIQRLRHQPAHAFWARVSPHPPDGRALCHSCHTPIDRNLPECASCGSRNTIDCPVCEQPLEAQEYQNIRLDVCKSCRGVWFDHAELTAIWKLGLESGLGRRGRTGLTTTANTPSLLVVDALTFMPDVLFLGARAAGYALSGAAETVASSGVAGGVADAAGSVFEAIVEIIAGIFS